MKKISFLIGVLFTLIVTNAFSYSTLTHTAITSAAVTQSTLTSDPTVIERLGLSAMLATDSNNPFRTGFDGDYIAMTATPGWLKADSFFEKEIIQKVRDETTGLAIPADTTLTGWIIRGVVREDDNKKENPSSDEPGGVFSRVFGHFYDPLYNAGLPVVGAKAVDWALIDGATVSSRKNLFNMVKTREAMWRALTGKTKDGADARPDNSSNFTTNEDVRKGYWATVFRSLGDTVHLLQDMAQPQHTRIDPHSGLGCLSASICVLGHDSFYEKYIAARTLQTKSFTLDEGVTDTSPGALIQINAPQLVYTGYNTPKFNTFADFFTTGTGTSGNASGRGLANYSNRGFYTAGTNINDTLYPSPDPSGLSLTQVQIKEPALVDMVGEKVKGSMTFYTGNVQDHVTGIVDTNVKLSSRGAWDQFLKKKNPLWSSYTLNYYNYDDQAKLLVPRAVAYSAGLIDYFFRGKMEISLPDTGVYGLVDHAKFAPGGANYPTNASTGFKGFDKIKLKLKNTTDPITPPGSAAIPQSMTQGTLVAILKFHRNTCYKDDLSGELNNQSPLAAQVAACRSENEDIAVSDPLPPRAVPAADTAPDGVELTFTFSGKQMPMNAWDVSLQVVYRGKLGSEDDAVAVATKDISEPTHVVFFSPFGWESKWSVLNLEPPVYPGYSAKFKLSFGPSQTPVTIQPPTEKSNLLVSPYFSRFAMLQDLAKPVEFTVACNCFSNSPFVEFLRPYVAQQGKPYEAMESTAGIAWWGINLPYMVTRAYIGGTPPAAPNADDVTHVPALPDWARYPVPVEISGW